MTPTADRRRRHLLARFGRTALVAALSVALVSTSAAANALPTGLGAQARSVPNEAVPTGSFSGTVRVGDRPAEAGEVRVVARAHPSGGYHNTVDTETLTGADGQYLIPALAPGTYSVLFDYVGTGPFADEWADDEAFFQPAREFAMADAAIVVDAALEPGATVRGIVRDSSGVPQADVRVSARFYEWEGPREGVEVATTTTAQDGSYRIDGISPDGTYLLSFARGTKLDGVPGWAEQERMATYRHPDWEHHFTLEAGMDLSGMDMELYRPTNIIVEVSCPTCPGPLATADYAVHLQRESVTPTGTVWVDELGSAESSEQIGSVLTYGFYYRLLPPGRYRVVPVSLRGGVIRAQPSEPFDLVDGQVVRPSATLERPLYWPDFSGDGSPDLLARTTSGALLNYHTDGSAGWRGIVQVGSGWQMFNTVFGGGDFDGLGAFDLLGRTPSGLLYLYGTDGRGGWLTPRVIGSGWQMFDTIFSPGDFDGDGTPDLIGRTPSGLLYLYGTDGHGGWLTPRVIGSGWQMFNAVFSPGDFDGDGTPDLIGRTPSGLLYLYGTDGRGGWLTPRVIGSGWQMFNHVFSQRDFDRDGKSDVLARTPSGLLYFYPGDGKGGWLTPRVIGSGWGPLSIVG